MKTIKWFFLIVITIILFFQIWLMITQPHILDNRPTKWAMLLILLMEGLFLAHMIGELIKIRKS